MEYLSVLHYTYQWTIYQYFTMPINGVAISTSLYLSMEYREVLIDSPLIGIAKY
jgi:hypothetical protein